MKTQTEEGSFKITRARDPGKTVKWPRDHPVWMQIIERVSTGKSLSLILADKGMPTWPTFYAMIDKDAQLRVAFEKATQTRADRLAEEILELSDQKLPAGLKGTDANAWVQHKRLQVDSRKWIAAHLKPKTYGDRLDVSVTDERISVLGAIEEARARVLTDQSNVIDVEPK